MTRRLLSRCCFEPGGQDNRFWPVWSSHSRLKKGRVDRVDPSHVGMRPVIVAGSVRRFLARRQDHVLRSHFSQRGASILVANICPARYFPSTRRPLSSSESSVRRADFHDSGAVFPIDWEAADLVGKRLPALISIVLARSLSRTADAPNRCLERPPGTLITGTAIALDPRLRRLGGTLKSITNSTETMCPTTFQSG
jgi:hypothetical protein